ncbi:hypothetical protein COT72_00245 [archaeon CG10_big_fil_rev_8_21_14_0_10_43_11]|nr:MAG: hypothetical protein COT72_00245 [archaeon CG10_big_fil_rev_8_21_14_0_10_43_11]
MHFVSISGISSPYELDELKHELGNVRFENHEIVIGYQFSHKSICQGPSNNRQPHLKDVTDLFETTRKYGFEPTIHYYTKDSQTIMPDLHILLKENHLDYFAKKIQFNTLPLESSLLEEVTTLFDVDIIFKVSVALSDVGAFKKEDYNIKELTNFVLERPMIRYAMFDPTHGASVDPKTGKKRTLNITRAGAFGKQMRKYHLPLIFAGGINSENASRVIEKLAAAVGSAQFSVDAESGLRKPNPHTTAYGMDTFNPKKAREYVLACKDVFG